MLKNRDGTQEGKTGLESRDRKQGWNTVFEKQTEGGNWNPIMETEEFRDFVRDSIVGKDIEITTPFGSRHLIYADYTASGRGIDFIENYLKYILELLVEKL